MFNFWLGGEHDAVDVDAVGRGGREPENDENGHVDVVVDIRVESDNARQRGRRRRGRRGEQRVSVALARSARCRYFIIFIELIY